MQNQDSLFYVSVREPVNFRRTVLGCSKDVIGCLKKYEHFKEFRHKHEEQAVVVKKLFDDLNLLSIKLHNALPKTKLKPQADVKSKSNPRKFDSHLDKIESDLAALETKLSRIK